LGGTESVTAINPSDFASVYRLNWDVGSDAVLARLGTSGTVLAKSFASAHHLRVGSRLSMLTPSGRHIVLVVRGIVTDNARLLGDLTITLPLARGPFAQSTDAVDFVSYVAGAHNAQVQPAVNRLLRARYPQAQSQTPAQFKASEDAAVNSLLAFVSVLLALSIIVSLFGIVNTLVLSIFERTRELGMLRAIGTTRRQIRQMIRYESIVIALIGGVLGIVLGVLATLVVAGTALSGTGFVLSIPVTTLVVLFILAGVAGLIAAAWPARRAARVDILAALATE
jgi:putative ABC transport system permease protein